MDNRKVYEIAFVGLKPGMHEFEYRIDDKFFVPYGEQDFNHSNIVVKLHLDKHSGFFMLKFDIDGVADVLCDRCGNSLSLKLWDEFSMIVKMVDDPEELNETEEDPDIFYISKNESHLRIADWIYDFINLSIPIQKKCNEDEIGGSQCNKEVLEKLKQMEVDTQKGGNPVWKGLEQFKNLE